MDIRENLKKLYSLRSLFDDQVQSMTEDYIKQLPKGDIGIFVTDHAIVRYLERIRNVELTGDTDTEKLHRYTNDVGLLRKEVLSQEDALRILRGRKQYMNMGDYALVIKNLAVVTILVHTDHKK